MQLLNVEQMTAADRLTIEGGTPGFALMQRAGEAVAEAAERLAPHGDILVVAGRGNNGGDGFVAATVLAGRGRKVAVALLCKPDSLKGDAACAAGEWKGSLLPFTPGAIGKPALIIDAIFGAGLDRPVKGDPQVMIDAINASGVPVLAVDLPSGINGSTGEVMGTAVRASETVTFFRKKPGHLLLPGRLYCGPVDVADIGIKESVLQTIGPDTFANVPELWRSSFPVLKVDGHKYGRGHAVVVSGGISETGAARMAARAALRAGAGLVTVASSREALPVNAAALTAVMVRAVDHPVEFGDYLKDPRLNAIVIGPGAGVGAHTRDFVLTALGHDRNAVLDADALTSFADQSDVLFNAIRAMSNAEVVMTPHEGEFARLFKSLADNDRHLSKLERARLAAKESGATVLIKGPDTVVASPDGRATIASNAPPWLATAGAGDVLAGMICGCLAQRVPAFEAASMAVWMHGEAAHEFGPGLIAEDLPEMLPQILAQLYESFEIED
ncbi:MAG: NAD(P)H-hydrate dehydratase [Xanthobacteraceae bacterium]|nr:NAD(P)H-hydrate dehydratase [Xanthobacteraceae bacterium]